MIDAHVMHIK